MISGCSASRSRCRSCSGDDIELRGSGYALGPSLVEQATYLFGRAGGGSRGKTRVRLELVGKRLKPFFDAILAHCSINARLAEALGLGDDVRDALTMSFAQWNSKGIPKGIGGTEIPMPVRVSALADLVEVGGAIEVANAWKRISLDPAVVDAWCAAAPEILAAVDGDAAREVVLSAPPNRDLSMSELDAGLELVADYAALKSPWFTGHSRAVADRTEAGARALGLPEDDVVRGRRAALLHDIGRTSVPNSIWDKPGPLDADEWERVRLHAHFTDRIVRRGGGLAALAPIAASAHERVDGGGYPRGIAGETIPLLGRVLGAADRYQALREDLTGAGHAGRSRTTGPAGLTQREVEVLVLAARGLTTRQIARQLDITPKTAGNHIEHIHAKVQISSRAEAAMFAMQHGLVGEPEP
jgi:DNA-binding CsgD family transcriptional regulator